MAQGDVVVFDAYLENVWDSGIHDFDIITKEEDTSLDYFLPCLFIFGILFIILILLLLMFLLKNHKRTIAILIT